MSKVLRVVAPALLMSGCAIVSAHAVVFSDNFDSYAYELNWAPPSAVWTVPTGSVDLVGETTISTGYDLYPGHRGYVDLDGSSGAAGTLQTAASFAAGSYNLSFDLGGNARGDVPKTTTITLGDWTTSLTLASSDPLALQTFTFATIGGPLSFSDDTVGNQNIGNVLDDVMLTIVAQAPEAPTWAMLALGFAGLAFAGLPLVAQGRASRDLS